MDLFRHLSQTFMDLFRHPLTSMDLLSLISIIDEEYFASVISSYVKYCGKERMIADVSPL